MNAELETCELSTPKKGVTEGVRICVKCGSPETSVLKDAIGSNDEKDMGKIFVTSIDDAIDLTTKVRGNEALWSH